LLNGLPIGRIGKENIGRLSKVPAWFIRRQSKFFRGDASSDRMDEYSD
jgi:hypothetical protein